MTCLYKFEAVVAHQSGELIAIDYAWSNIILAGLGNHSSKDKMMWSTVVQRRIWSPERILKLLPFIIEIPELAQLELGHLWECHLLTAYTLLREKRHLGQGTCVVFGTGRLYICQEDQLLPFHSWHCPCSCSRSTWGSFHWITRMLVLLSCVQTWYANCAFPHRDVTILYTHSKK